MKKNYLSTTVRIKCTFIVQSAKSFFTEDAFEQTYFRHYQASYRRQKSVGARRVSRVRHKRGQTAAGGLTAAERGRLTATAAEVEVGPGEAADSSPLHLSAGCVMAGQDRTG